MNNLDQPEFLPAPPPATPGSPQPPTPQKVKRFGWPTLIITAVLALGVGGLVGGGGASSTTTQPTVTVTETVPASEPDFSDEPSTEPDSAGSASEIDKADFKLSIKEKSKKCYGYGVGCTIEYKVDMAADQTGWPDEGTIDLVYKITGGSEGSETNTITVDAAEGTYEQDGYQYADTSSRGVKLKISIVSIDYSEF